MTSPSLSDRKRSVDLNNFSDAEIDALSIKIGSMVADKINHAIIECQKILQIYQMDITLSYKMHPIGQPNYQKPVDLTAEELDAEAAAMSLKDDQEVVGTLKTGRPKKVSAAAIMNDEVGSTPKKRGRPKKTVV